MNESKEQSTAARAEAERANVAAMIAVVRAVLDIHRPTGSTELWCKECVDLVDNGHESSAAWPCKTVRAIFYGGIDTAWLAKTNEHAARHRPKSVPFRGETDELRASCVVEHRPMLYPTGPGCACGVLPAVGTPDLGAWWKQHLVDEVSGAASVWKAEL